MTPQEAKKLVKTCGLNIEGKKYVECESVILSALEKQIPKNPYLLNYGGYEVENWNCPNGHIVGMRDTFCKHCGQALDWSDTE